MNLNCDDYKECEFWYEPSICNYCKRYMLNREDLFQKKFIITKSD